jgi:HEAT repeat protein
LAFATPFDPLPAFALSVGAGALAASIVFLVGTVASRIRLLLRLNRRANILRLWTPVLAECTERVPASLPAFERQDVEPFLVLWCKTQESLRGEAQDRLRELARRLGLAPVAVKRLGSWSQRRKLLAIVSLGHMRERAALPSLLRLASKAPAVVSMTAAQAVVRIDPDVGVPLALAMSAARRDWAIAKAASMLMECDAARTEPLLAAAIRAELRGQRNDNPPGGALARLVRLHVVADGREVRAAVLEVLAEAHDTEPLAAAVAALSRPDEAPHARRLLAHADWQVRAAAARALRRIGGSEDFACLCAALGDSSWWVRYRAAQALCALPGIDSADLRAIPERLTDAFAADILRQVLAEQAFA